MAKGKKMKLNLGKRITGSLMSAGTGAVVNVAESAIGKSDMMNYGMLAAGALLPAFVPGDLTETLGGSLTTIAGYKIAESLGLGDKLGLTPASTTGLGDRSMIASARFRNAGKKKSSIENRVNKGGMNVMGV